MKKRVLLPVLLILAGLLYYVDIDLDALTANLINEEQPIESYVGDTGDVQVYFCPHQNCEEALLNFIDSAEESLHCAFFEVDLDLIRDKLLEKERLIDVKVITDNDYLYEFNHPFVKNDSWGLMHNKFCIVDGKKVSTGSMNPTNNGADKNNNNLLLINSVALANNYQAEFQEMWNGTYKKGDNVLNPNIMIDDIGVENYFCPEDDCADHVKEELNKATSSIHFMTFSFTHDGIANILLLKNLDNISIKGIFEARQVSKYSKYMVLKNNNVDVVKDGNKANMHHKVFIIDSDTVITGSFNPSAGGDTRNDENLLIIRDFNIASLFMEEFEKVWDERKE
jgi:phosphatidylserine/phosphatidylglycerophosphate/cardiolipin synthase-like enzyme